MPTERQTWTSLSEIKNGLLVALQIFNYVFNNNCELPVKINSKIKKYEDSLILH
jgi:hypothetical protein